MGFDIADWTTHTGAMYMGAGTSWEVIWTLISAAICVLELVIGSRHELDAYKRMKDGKDIKTGHG